MWPLQISNAKFFGNSWHAKCLLYSCILFYLRYIIINSMVNWNVNGCQGPTLFWYLSSCEAMGQHLLLKEKVIKWSRAYLFGDHFLYSHDLTVWFRAITVIPVATLAEKNANCEDFQGANYLYVDNGPNRSVQSWLLLINGWNFVPHTIPYNVFKFSYNGSSRNLINTESRIMWRFHELIVLLFLETWASDACCVTNMLFHLSDSQFWEVILIHKITFYCKITSVVMTVTIIC